MMLTKKEAEDVLRTNHQEHVMRWFDDLSEEQQQELIRQIGEIDWRDIALAKKHEKLPVGELAPLEAVDVDEIATRKEEEP